MKWHSSITQLYKQNNMELEECMTDYNIIFKQNNSGWTLTFSHLFNVKGIEAMQKLLAESSEIATLK
ncbi:hypothetical protein [Legionella spiritensis]|uniref:Uncharacterized protein n=1 Tax=Legionella spiritensis TaxID=452 RepID=A0A0W0YYV4_LEGSP|nr:hypothetical protein [Legionella spiritensis]KTD62077.1 hypothetical protein Lspi_1927 [Legionella spiritensis]SNV34301.1 Uncharacterised protein [Legionella spiritensis]